MIWGLLVAVIILGGWCLLIHKAVYSHKQIIVRITEEMANAMHDFNEQVEQFNLMMAREGEPMIEFTLEDNGGDFH